MIKKKISKKDLDDWKSFLADPSVIQDKDSVNEEILSSKKRFSFDFHGYSINEANKNKVKNIEFKCLDIRNLKKENNKTYDYIITKRSIQNLTKWSYQKKVIDNLHLFSKKKIKNTVD